MYEASQVDAAQALIAAPGFLDGYRVELIEKA